MSGRVVRDKSFFMAELRQKMGLLAGELNKLNSEFDVISKENSSIAAFEKK
jgi:intraflagellar transport protein 74